MSAELSPVKLSIRQTTSNGMFLVASALGSDNAGAQAASAYAAIGDAIRAAGMEIVQERIFASLSVASAVKTARREALQARGVYCDGPLTYLEGRPTWGHGFAGVIVRAVVADSVRTIREDGISLGRAWQADGVTFTILQGIQGLQSGMANDDVPASQARRMIERADSLLRRNGIGYQDTVRTWFYLSNILDWYGEFNRSRNDKYAEFGLLPGPGEGIPLLPASTGINAGLLDDAACSLDLLAVSGSVPGVPIVEHLRNPKQREAYCYGAAFSRCTVIHGHRENLIEVSGTAAIDEEGLSLYPGDVRAQVRCTLEKTAALLDQVRASLHDICAATVFLKHGTDAEAVREVLSEFGLDRLSAVWVQADVCRDELLFEIDSEVVIPVAAGESRAG